MTLERRQAYCQNLRNELKEVNLKKAVDIFKSFLRELNQQAFLNSISNKKEEDLEKNILELLEEQEEEMERIKNSKKESKENFQKIRDFFKDKDSKKEDLLKVLRATVCSENKVIRRKARKLLIEIGGMK